MKKVVFYTFLLVLLLSCGGVKKVPFDKMPTWLRERPSSEDYFIGIGSAKKMGTPDSYMKLARESALSDMSQSISVKISSVSTSNILEGKNELYETFQQNIKSKTSEIFEGVELVDQFDDGENYNTFYRINKSEFFKRKSERKTKALSLGLSYYMQAKEQEREGHISSALSLYVKVLNAIVFYLGEDTKISSEGRDIELAYEARNSFDRLAMSLSISAINKSLEYNRGESVKNSELTFIVEYDSEAVMDIPVIFKYTGGYLNNMHDISDNNGEVSTSINKITSRKSLERVNAELDFKDLVRKASDNLFIRKLFASNTRKLESISLNIIAPSIFLYSNKKDKRYLDRLSTALENKGLNVYKDSDYALHLSVDKAVKKDDYSFKITYKVNIRVKSTEMSIRNRVFVYNFSDESINKNTAETKALKKLNRAIDRLISSEIFRFVLK
ncbi:MAG: LPP20 family lipoprotein [Marinifilaceae bacterium]